MATTTISKKRDAKVEEVDFWTTIKGQPNELQMQIRLRFQDGKRQTIVLDNTEAICMVRHFAQHLEYHLVKNETSI
jgi:predicted transposase YbfD/YdcC